MYLKVKELDYIISLINSDVSESQSSKDELLKKLEEEKAFIFDPRTSEQEILKILHEHKEQILDMNEKSSDSNYPTELAQNALFRVLRANYPQVKEDEFSATLEKMKDDGLIYSKESEFQTFSYTVYGIKTDYLFSP